MNIAVKTSVPTNSKIEHLARNAYFCDAWEINAVLPELDPLEQFLRIVSATPKWIDSAMILRNKIVGLVGLKDLGRFSDIDLSKQSSEYALKERVGIFTLIDKNEHEALLGDDDKHLKVVVSIHKNVEPLSGKTKVTVSTVVHVKSWLGRLYMLPVAPAHYIIARHMTQAIGNEV